MTVKEFEDLLESEFEQVRGLATNKGKDYSQDYDRLSNFKEAAQRLGLTPYQVIGTYMDKHYNAICAFMRNGKVESEPIEGRIHDMALYLFLLQALIEDK